MLDVLANFIIDYKIIVSPAQAFPSFLSDVDKRHIRLMPRSTIENQCFVVKDGLEVLQFLRNATHAPYNTFAIWSDSKSMTDSMRTLFDYAWDASEPVY
jgi:hypothetical protein